MRSRTRVLRAAVIVVVAMVVALAFSSGAYAADNTGCLTCHGGSLSVAVPDVDLVTLTACKACHIPGLVGSHPYHQPGANCAAACHPTWGDSLPTAIPNVSESGASFASTLSKNTSPAVLHIIHSAPRWPANVSTTFSECGSCHQAAACNACHTGAVASAVIGGKAQHGVHSTLGKPASSLPIYPSWTGTVGRGVTGVDQTVNTIATETNQCAAAGCHNLEGTKANRSKIVEDYAYGAGGNPEDPTGTNAAVSYVGTWRVRYHSVYTGGRASYTNVLGAQLNGTFTGTRVEVITDTDPYRGKAEVWVNGVKEPALLDCYSAATVNGAVVFSKEFASAGPHTISIRPTGTKSASARAAYVLIDGFSVYAGLPDSVAPNCTSCHAAQAENHGGDFSHEATHTAGVYSGLDCTDCHSINMFTEHGRSSSKTSAASCAACHTVYAGFALNTYDFTCGGTGVPLTGATQPCHSAGQAQHTFTEPTLIDAAHVDTNATPSAALAECWSCHTKNLATIHNNSVTSNDGDVPPVVTSCLSCHGPAIFPETADCTNVACHTVTGVHSMATHPAPAHMATNDGQGTVPRTGGKSCSTCHALEIANPAGGEHAKAASVTDPGAAAIGCVECHAAPYFNSVKPWIDTTVPYTTNTCIACHKVDSGLPGATTAGEPHELADYTSEHNYNAGLNTSCGSITMTCHSGSTAMLGNITNADTLHAVSKPGNADCTSCHTNNTAVPTQRQCLGCHVNHDTIPVHNSAQTDFATNGDCLPCHSGYDNLAFGHSGCGTCHDNAILTATETRYLQSAFTGECLGCHNATVIGTQAYYTADPNHYNETTHTANIAADTVATGGTTITDKACTACHSDKIKVEHVVTLSASGDMSVNCIECHTNAISTATIDADWLPGKKCANCHGALHNSLGTSHDMSASAAALSCDGGGCHDGSNIATLHADRVLSTDAAKTSCNVCHTDADTALTATACDSAGCHSGAGHSHPLSVPTSTYSVAAQTGCVASGAGCHVDADADYASLNYHPNAGCISGPCHTATNHSDTQFDNPNTCQNCHGGGVLVYDNAPDVVATSGLQIADHYNETTHTVAGLTNVVRGTTDGAASAACSACHDDSAPTGLNDLWYQHQGIRTGDLTCYACHNKSAEISVLVSDTTRTDTCAACHTTGTGLVEAQHSGANAPAVTGSSTAGCGASGTNCHTTYDLHELHKDSAKGCGTSDGTTNMVGCHDFREQGIKPTIKTCAQVGGCHAAYDRATHYGTYTADHTSTLQGAATYTLNGQSPVCSSCHSMALDPEHSLATSALTGAGATVCEKCHNETGSTTAITGKWAGELCSACHGQTGIDAQHLNVSGHNVTNTGCGNSGAGCHPTQDLSKAGTDKTVNIHNDCATCHDPAGATTWTYGVTSMKYSPLETTCGGASGCHTNAYYSATGPQIHSIGQAGERNGDDALHAADATAMATTVGAYTNSNACSNCHSASLNTAHATTNLPSDATCSSGGSTGQGCHNSTVLSASPTQVKSNWTNDLCTDCHNVPANVHNTYTAGTHTSTVGSVADNANNCITGGCHLGGSTDVRTMHDRATSGCTATGQDTLNGNGGANAACHALNKAMVAGTMSCGKGGTGTIACHINHDNSNHGVSPGGMDCYRCHGEYQSTMEDGTGTKTGATRTSSYHHVMGSATNDGDKAFLAGSYPTSQTDVYCMSCHVDHDKFNANKANNLRANFGSEAGLNADFVSVLPANYSATTLTQTQGTWVNPANSTGAENGTVATSPNTPYEGRHSFSLGAVSGISGASLTVQSKAYGKWGTGSIPASSGTNDYSPTANGTQTQGTWAITGGMPTHWESVDEYPTGDNTTTYIGTVTTGQIWRLFTNTAVDIPVGATINNVSVTYDSRWRTTASNATARLRIGGANYDGALAAQNAAMGTPRTVTWNTNPRTTVAWTRDDVMGVGANALQEFGYFVNNNTESRLTMVYLSVAYTVTAQNWTNDDTWQIDYSVNNGTNWSPVVASNMAIEPALTPHTIDLSGILTDANKGQFLVRVKGNQVNTADAGALVDWDSSTLSITTGVGPGACLSCHTVSLTKDTANQKSYAAPPSTVTPAIASTDFGSSAHNFAASSTLNGGTTFAANCVKCHDDEQTTKYQTSTNKFGTHWSGERRLMAAMGITVADPLAEETECYKCHSVSANGYKTTTNQDWYGVATMGAASQNIYAKFTSTYKHNVAGYVGLHPTTPTDETRTYISTLANKHVECGDCHDVHSAAAGSHTPAGTADDTGNNISATLAGVPGVTVTFSTTSWTAPTYTAALGTATDEYQICFKCHSGYNTNVTGWGGTGAAAWTDQGLEFSPKNQSYHPVVAALPATDPGVNGSNRLAQFDMRAAGTAGGMAVGGWTVGDTMYCSDCHAEGSTGSLGPHGSAVKWMLKGPNRAWPYTTAAGNGTSTGTFRTLANWATGDGTADGLFCYNCHVQTADGVDLTRHVTTSYNHSSYPCVACHIRVPHGGKVSRLIKAASTQANLPARYMSNGNGSNVQAYYLTRFVKRAPDGYAIADCGVGGTSCYGSHNNTTGETW